MRYVALLRGINVSGKKRVPMAQLRALATQLGLEDPATYIQSGNLIFTSPKGAPDLEDALESALEKHFGFPVVVIVRTRKQWEKYAAATPYPEAETERPNMLLLGLCKAKLAKDAAASIASRAKDGERVTAFRDGIWVDFPKGSGNSKITPAVLDRACGAPVTTRNFKTVRKIVDLF